MSSIPSEPFILTHEHKRVVIRLSSTRKLHLPRFSATSGKSFAGLETLFPGQTDLALTNVQTEGSSCEDSSWTVLFPNSFSYGVLANIGSGAVPGQLRGAGSGRFREGSGAGSERQVPGGSGKVPGQVPNDRFREVPGSFRGRLRTTGSGKVPGQTGSGKVPGQVLNDRFRAGSEPRSEPWVPGRFRGRF